MKIEIRTWRSSERSKNKNSRRNGQPRRINLDSNQKPDLFNST